MPSEPGYLEGRGRRAYEAYSAAAGGRSLKSGERLPAWDALEQPIRVAWGAASDAAGLQAIEEDGRVLPPPSVSVELAKLRVAPGDVLIVTRRCEFTPAVIAALVAQLGGATGCPVVVLPVDAALAAISAADIDAARQRRPAAGMRVYDPQSSDARMGGSRKGSVVSLGDDGEFVVRWDDQPDVAMTMFRSDWGTVVLELPAAPPRPPMPAPSRPSARGKGTR